MEKLVLILLFGLFSAISATKTSTTTETSTEYIVYNPTECYISGCNHEICSDTASVSPCIFNPIYSCLKYAWCQRKWDGTCGWNYSYQYFACARSINRVGYYPIEGGYGGYIGGYYGDYERHHHRHHDHHHDHGNDNGH